MKHNLQLLVFFILLVFTLPLSAGFLSPDQIRTAAARLMDEKLNRTEDQLSISYSDFHMGHIALRAFNLSQGGFLLIAGHDAAFPLLAYSHTGSFSGEMSPALVEWLSMYSEQILLIDQMQAAGLTGVHEEWTRLLSEDFHPLFPETTVVGPLLTCNWNQGKYYNAFCPADPAGPGGKVYAGCVATAMGMAMHHFKYPMQGTGTHGYYASNYGYLSANFGSTQYDWFAMENNIDNHYNDEVAELLYQCGVGVEMNYSPTGSGAYMWEARNALVDFFGYSTSSTLAYKSSYSDAGWKTMVKQQIDQGKPLIYAGYPSAGGSGHAFILDGYQNTDHFHFNWGWSAAYNGYFYLSALNPGGNDFAGGQQAIINLYPGANYPAQCAGSKALTATRGMVFDGSGPVDYQHNSDCIWIITPGNVEKFLISIDRLKLGDPGDSLIIYSGAGTLDTILFAFSSDTVVLGVVANTDAITVRFKTNSILAADGFILSYQAVLKEFCSGTSVFTDNSGTVSDGSGPDNYRDGTLCKWRIEPGNGLPVGFTFTSVDLNTGDLVRVYDSGSQPGILLAQVNGNQAPPTIVSPSGKMLIIFYADQNLSAGGWEAEWVSGANIGFGPIGDLTGKMNIYPNPAGSECSIVLPQSIEVLRVGLYDLSGRNISVPFNMKDPFHLGLDLRDVAAGLYVVRVETAQGVNSGRLEVIR